MECKYADGSCVREDRNPPITMFRDYLIQFPCCAINSFYGSFRHLTKHGRSRVAGARRIVLGVAQQLLRRLVLPSHPHCVRETPPPGSLLIRSALRGAPQFPPSAQDRWRRSRSTFRQPARAQPPGLFTTARGEWCIGVAAKATFGIAPRLPVANRTFVTEDIHLCALVFRLLTPVFRT